MSDDKDVSDMPDEIWADIHCVYWYRDEYWLADGLPPPTRYIRADLYDDKETSALRKERDEAREALRQIKIHIDNFESSPLVTIYRINAVLLNTIPETTDE